MKKSFEEALDDLVTLYLEEGSEAMLDMIAELKAAIRKLEEA